MLKRLVSRGLACSLVFSLAAPMASAADDYTVTGKVGGEAYGALIDLRALLGLVKLHLGPIPHAVLPPTGGLDSDVVLGVALPGIISSQTLPVFTAGATGPRIAGSSSVAAVETLDLLGGLIRADAIVAACSSRSDGLTASSDTRGSVLANLVIGGLAIPLNPKPNTRIPLLNGFLKIGEVILNEQVHGGDGIKTSTVDVNMLHVKVKDGGILLNGQLLKGDIIVSSAHCAVDATQVPGTPGDPSSMVGSGTIGSGTEEIATFGFTAKEGEGELNYIDLAANLQIESASVTSFAVSGNCAQFSGPAKINNTDGYTYEVNACDNGEPGVDSDTFTITGTGPGGFYYTRSGTLTGGNLLLN